MATNDGIATDQLEILPKVGMNGIYNAKPPFDNRLNSQVSYSCTDIATLNSLIANGGDPFNEIYVPVGLSSSVYELDLQKNHCIVTLQASSGVFIRIPSSYLVGFPDANGIYYSRVILGVALSAIPDSLDLTSLSTEVADLIRDRLGVKSEIKTIVISPKYIVSQEDHSAIESARATNIRNSETSLMKAARLQIQNTALLQKVAELENFIKINHI